MPILEFTSEIQLIERRAMSIYLYLVERVSHKRASYQFWTVKSVLDKICQSLCKFIDNTVMPVIASNNITACLRCLYFVTLACRHLLFKLIKDVFCSRSSIMPCRQFQFYLLRFWNTHYYFLQSHWNRIWFVQLKALVLKIRLLETWMDYILFT